MAGGGGRGDSGGRARRRRESDRESEEIAAIVTPNVIFPIFMSNGNSASASFLAVVGEEKIQIKRQIFLRDKSDVQMRTNGWID